MSLHFAILLRFLCCFEESDHPMSVFELSARVLRDREEM